MKVVSLILNKKHLKSEMNKERQNIIKFILYSLNLFYTFPENLSYELNNANILESEFRITIIKDKMSRIILETHNKIETFSFPFILTLDDKLKFSLGDIIIEKEDISLLNTIFHKYDFTTSLDLLVEKTWMAEEGIFTKKEIGRLVSKLTTFELAYVRYDYDEERADGKLHPKIHLDVNLKNETKYKIGLNDKLSRKEFIDILNINTECWYIEKK